MEATVQAVEDRLIDSLKFQISPTASYVTNRRSVTFHPQGGNSYGVKGVKVIKISLTGDEWLDRSAVKLFSLTETLQHSQKTVDYRLY